MADEIFKLDENGALALNTILSTENPASPYKYDEVFTLDTEGKVAIRVVGATGGGTPAAGGGKLVGFVDSSSTRFPPAQRLDYVKVESTETNFPFTVRGITFNNVNDSAIYTGTQWVKYSFIAETDSLEVSTPADESLAGDKTTQKAINIENKEAIEELQKLVNKMFIFKGYIADTEPVGSIKEGLYWYESDVLPSSTDFPIQVKVYEIVGGTGRWSTSTIAYTPNELDLWSNLNDDQGYYWFANDWNTIDSIGGDLFEDVASLPTTNIDDQVIYRTSRYKYTRDGQEIPEPTGYVVLDDTMVTADANGLHYDDAGTTVDLEWALVSDAVVADLITQGYVGAATSFESADFFKGENADDYFYKTSVTKELVWELYYNPTKNAADYQMIGNSGGTADVLVDNITVQKIGGKLQANAIIDVAMLPISNIKANTIYRIVETTPIRMVKLYTYENGNWINHSRIEISQENYDLLTTAQKNDGTIYIIDELAQYLIQFTYKTLADKPSINGITLLDALTLDDLGIYSKDQIDAFLADKAQAEFVDELPPTLQHQVWYYSKKYEDGTLVPNDKRALYIYDDNDVLQFMGVVGEVDLSDYVAKENIQTGLDNDFFYRYSNGTTDYYTRTSSGDSVTVYAMTFAGQKVTAITAQSESGAIANDTLTFSGADYPHNANGDGFYVINGTDKVVATSALSAVLDKAGRVNDVKLNDKSLVENKEAKLVGLDTIENNYFYKWANGTNYRYTKTKTIGSGVDVYTITFSGSEVDTITKDSATGVIAMAANGADLQLTQSSNTYILDNSYTASKYYIVGAKEKLLTAGVVEEAKDFSKCFEGLYMTPQPESDWKYVGILPASNGSTLKVEDDWKELLLIARVSEGSSYFNLTNVVPKQGFTQGNPNGNNTFIGFFWNESFNCKIRIGLEGTGTNRVVKQNYSNQTGWVLNGTYVYKRG